MKNLQLDHLVITAYELEAGVDYIERVLGVRMQTGGVHMSMGTHNAVLKLGERQYLEVIAPNPEAPNPSRSRWFDLDRLKPHSIPRFVTWVVRTSDIQSTMLSSKELMGPIESMSRGDYRWLINIPQDGSMPFHGILPAFIEWQQVIHPVEKLADSGCRLNQLEAYHQEPESLVRLFESLGIQDLLSVFQLTKDDRPYLVAYIDTPNGVMQLSGKND